MNKNVDVEDEFVVSSSYRRGTEFPVEFQPEANFKIQEAVTIPDDSTFQLGGRSDNIFECAFNREEIDCNHPQKMKHKRSGIIRPLTLDNYINSKLEVFHQLEVEMGLFSPSIDGRCRVILIDWIVSSY